MIKLVKSIKLNKRVVQILTVLSFPFRIHSYSISISFSIIVLVYNKVNIVITDISDHSKPT
jgi:hypothetical protein